MTEEHRGRAARYLMSLAASWLLLGPAAAQPGPQVTHSNSDAEGTDYLWLNSDPSGATVEIDGQEKGVTPVFINELAPGNYSIRFVKRGYQPLSRTFEVPNEGQEQTSTLRLRDDVCLIESTPTGASVLHGTQLLGRTPLLLEGWPAGSHEFRLMRPGYEPTVSHVTVAPGLPTRVSATLTSNVGSIRLTTMPAGARILVDGAYKGTGARKDPRTNKSVPVDLPGFTQGAHQVQIEYRGVRSELRQVTVTKGRATETMMMLWYPDVRVQRKSGGGVVGMLLQEDAGGGLVVARTLTDHQRILADDIARVEELPAAESQRILKSGGSGPRPPR